MRVVSIVAGAGSMYCGACLHASTLAVMSLPTVWPESKGLPVLEAWANGVPVVVPAHGAFPELVEDTGGGLLFAPHDPRSLAAALEQLIRDPAIASELGRRGRDAVHDRYHADRMASQTAELYRQVVMQSQVTLHDSEFDAPPCGTA